VFNSLRIGTSIGRVAFTLTELLIVIGIIAILSLLLLPVVSGFRARAQRVQCMANLRTLYSASELFIQQNGSWPQIDIEDSESQEASAWIAALKPFGVSEKSWICPTIQNLMQNPDYTQPGNIRVDYIATPFDDKPTTPHEWPRQPWFIEVADVHGHGNLIIFTDGSISDLKTVGGK
jgi:type II secretory pathway pseudopilin PulG